MSLLELSVAITAPSSATTLESAFPIVNCEGFRDRKDVLFKTYFRQNKASACASPKMFESIAGKATRL